MKEIVQVLTKLEKEKRQRQKQRDMTLKKKMIIEVTVQF